MQNPSDSLRTYIAKTKGADLILGSLSRDWETLKDIKSDTNLSISNIKEI